MLRIFCASPIHKWLSASLAFIFFFAVVLIIPVGADDVVPSPSPSPIRPNPPIGWQDGDSFRDIMLVVLDSWGISFSDPSGDSILLDLFDSLFEEFLDVTNQYAYEFWDDVKYGANEFGNLILDFTGVNAIRQFANWLVDRFSLVDNNLVSATLPSISSPEGLQGFVYNEGSVIAYGSGNRYPILKKNNGWAFFFIGRNAGGNSIGGNWDVIYSFSDVSYDNALFYSSSNQAIGSKTFQFDGKTFYGYGMASNSQYGGLVTENVQNIPVFYDIQFFTPNGGDNLQAIASVLNIYWQDVPDDPVINIITRDIDIPSADFDPDDGLKIEIPGTNWGDSIFSILDLIERLIGLYDNTQLEIVSIVDTLETLIANLQRSVTVENIPGAVTLDYDEYDIPLESEWGLIDDFYGLEFSEDDTLFTPFDTLKSLIFGLPEPLLLFLSVIIVWIVAYGFIRMGRDSH